MNILHIIHSVNPETGGPIEGILSSAGLLRDLGCQREVLSLDSPSEAWVKSCPLKVYPVGIRHPKYPAWRQKFRWLRYGYSPHLVPWLKANAHRYDAIIVNGLWNYGALGSRRVLPQSNTPYFVYPHGMAVQCHERVVAYGSLDAPGDPETQRAAFHAQLPEIAGRRFLLFLSRIPPKKGCDLLIEAFANVAAKDPKYHGSQKATARAATGAPLDSSLGAIGIPLLKTPLEFSRRARSP
jgi:glycosyltransferase involved in cell wall biosynthesis